MENDEIYKTYNTKNKNSYYYNTGYKLLLISKLSKKDKKLINKTSKKSYFIAEHRLIIARSLNRPLFDNELVHHKNGIRTDNRIENLELLNKKSHHPGNEFLICPKCGHKF